MLSWWSCWLGAIIFGMVVFYTLLVTVVPYVWITTPFWATNVITILTLGLTGASAFFLIKVVKLVSESQIEGVSAISTFE